LVFDRIATPEPGPGDVLLHHQSSDLSQALTVARIVS
jgi:hypothetical protein